MWSPPLCTADCSPLQGEGMHRGRTGGAQAVHRGGGRTKLRVASASTHGKLFSLAPLRIVCSLTTTHTHTHTV
eukprot:509855-Prorocentrum_minimum.AAC.2